MPMPSTRRCAASRGRRSQAAARETPRRLDPSLAEVPDELVAGARHAQGRQLAQIVRRRGFAVLSDEPAAAHGSMRDLPNGRTASWSPPEAGGARAPRRQTPPRPHRRARLVALESQSDGRVGFCQELRQGSTRRRSARARPGSWMRNLLHPPCGADGVLSRSPRVPASASSDHSQAVTIKGLAGVGNEMLSVVRFTRCTPSRPLGARRRGGSASISQCRGLAMPPSTRHARSPWRTCTCRSGRAHCLIHRRSSPRAASVLVASRSLSRSWIVAARARSQRGSTRRRAVL